MSIPDEIQDTNVRYELDSHGRPIRTEHQTRVTLTRGLQDAFRVDGLPVAVLGSSGDNTSADHMFAKEGQVLIPLPLAARIVDGIAWFSVSGLPVGVASSTVHVPDCEKPMKSGVFQMGQDFFTLDGEAVLRGAR